MTHPHAAIVAAASAALGADLSGPAGLASSNRSAVLRCATASGGTVVVKAYLPDPDAADSFAAEASGLALAGPAGLGPSLLAADPAERVLVMTDLGDPPSLADLLLDGTAEAARAALTDWAVACGRLAVATAGRAGELAGLRAGYRAPGPAAAAGAGRDEPGEHWLARRVREAADLPGLLGVAAPPGLAADLASVLAVTGPGECEVFSPGDICPDNNLLTPSGVRFIDFESAEYHQVYLDAAYLRMPFSTCWCVFRLPAEVARAAEAAYRDLVAGVFPALTDDATWQAGVRRATAAWTLHAMTYLLEPSLTADASMNPDRVPAPSARQLLRYRWQWLAGELDAGDDLPALAELVRRLLRATEHWQAAPMPPYPAFG